MKKAVPTTSTAVFVVEDHGFEIDEQVKANGTVVKVTDVQGPIVYFSPAVEMDKHKGVTIERIE